MTWYGKNTKQLDTLIDTKPSLQQLLALPEFTQQIKSYNSKLLDYITNTPTLITEAITYLTVAPSLQDSPERKFKLPLQTIELVETETPCILNGFFKEGGKDALNFDLMFSVLDNSEVLPLLAGYFFRTSLCLLNNKYKQTVERVYLSSRIFLRLIANSQHMALSNTIQLFLNLDINKNVPSTPQRLNLKLQVIRTIFARLKEEGRRRGPDSGAIIENLCSVLVETVDKYYLIVDGKQMIEAICAEQQVQVLFELVRDNNEVAFPAFSFFIALINYYSFSSFNNDDPGTSPETLRKNAQRLQTEPMIRGIVQMLGPCMQRIGTTPRMDLYHYRLLQMFCHCISIASSRILSKVCQVRFFGVLISLLFKHQTNNILHMLVEKSFYHIFISQRKIYEEYKRHLFCDLDIIQMTGAKMLKMFGDGNFWGQARKKPYIGHFMRILKIYSSFQPTDEVIINAIKAKTGTWNKISELLIKPYQAICLKELGQYDNVPTPNLQDFNIRQHKNMQHLPQNAQAIEEVEKQQLYPRSPNEKKVQQNKQREDSNHNYLFDKEPDKLKMVDHLSENKIEDDPQMSFQSTPVTSLSSSTPMPSFSTQAHPKDLQKTNSYKDYLNKQLVVAGEDIESKKRSLSQDRRINTSRGSRSKITSPSPNKKNSWKEKDDKEEKTANQSRKNQPPVPKAAPRRPVGPATYSIASERQNRWVQEEPKSNQVSKSLNLQEVKKIRVIQIDVPKQKKYRKTDEKDKALLQFLGISL